MTSSNNNKGVTNNPIATLHQLQSELYALREKHIHALEIALAALEKEGEKQKVQLDKTREQLKQYQERLKDPKNAKPSAQGRIKTSLASAQRNFDNDQAALAQLRGNIIEQRLVIRKEKAVLKAMLDTDKTLGKVSKPSQDKPVAAPKTKPKAPAQAKPAPKATPSKPAAKAKTTPKVTATVSTPMPAASKSAPKAPANGAKPSAEAASAAVNTPAAKPAPVALLKPKRRVRRMSDIPSHPDKATDRLASLFDDF
ncbi:hypothetical protein [Zhongshania borealis]|uniref:Uncharacterized protein n=1 Tax=Zhongshania borealis TaxID=889488 RepID=A0ABP7WQV6_9GAMM